MNKKIITPLFVLLIVVIGLGAYALSEPNKKENNNTSNDSNVDTSLSDTSTPLRSLTMSEVALHNSEDDCWTIVTNKVYDITSYIPRHPGGDDIVVACGGDGTALFTQREDSNGDAVGSGTPHSQNATSQLAKLEIGQLTEE